jgi:HEAT repeat protein
MSKPLQRFTAVLLVFSIILQSCYTPLEIRNKKQAAPPRVDFNKSGKNPCAKDATPLGMLHSELDCMQAEDNRYSEDGFMEYEKNKDQALISQHNQSISHAAYACNLSAWQSISFYQEESSWKARLKDANHALDLDVVCSPGVDVEALNHMPKAQSKQLIHRVKHPKKDFIYLGKMGLQGGMFGNVSDRTSKMEEKDIPFPLASQPSSSRGVLDNVIDRTAIVSELQGDKARELSISPQRRHSREIVQGLIEQRDDLQDTESLVRAFNKTESKVEASALQRWLEGYIDWFIAQPIENLKETDLEEYSSLADIQPNTKEHKSLVQRYLFSLVNKIESNTHGRIPVVQTLYYSLMSVDKAVFAGDTTFLIQLGNDLLDKLNSEKTVFTKFTYPSYQPLLYALHQTLVLIQLIAPCQWSTSKESDEDKRGALYCHFKEKLEAIVDKADYYPFVYHSMLLLQSLSRLENKKGLCQKENINLLYKGDQDRRYIDKVIGSLLTLDLDTYSLQTSYESLKASLEKKLAEASDWYDLLQAINQAAFLSLASENETNAENFYCLFKNDMKQLLPLTKTDPIQAFFFPDLNKILLDNEEAERALHYGIVSQLRELALDSPLAIIRLECLLQLESLTQTENWAEDAEVMEELLDSLAMIAKQRQKERQLESSKAKGILEILRNSIPQEAIKRGKKKNTLTATQENIKDWLGKSSLEDRLEEKEEAKIAQDLGCVYSKVSESLGLSMPMAQSEARQLLQTYYQDKFAYIHKLSEDEAPQLVATAQYQLMLLEQKPVKEEKEGAQGKENDENIIEQKNRPEEEGKKKKDQIATHQERMQLVKTPIKLENLFKARSTQEGGPVQEVRKVLLVGNPGTGKTTVSRQLAYLWANGQGDEIFQNVYVIPVRALQQTEYDGRSLRRASNLATAIANLCFGNIVNDEDYNRLRLRINASLKSPNTLVVLDGLDERLGCSETLIEEAQEGNHKLLMLSRPYGLEDLRKGIDLEVEHAGFNQAQVENYVQKYFAANNSNKDSNGKDLLKFLKQYPSLDNISHVPVNLCILCSLWKQDSGELEKVKGSLTKLYEGLTKYLWERYAAKCNEKGPSSNKLQNKHKKDLFDTLGEIALYGLEKGEILISYRTMDKVLEGVEENELMLDMLKGSGLLEKVGMEYQFPHLTFQEYFASKALAKLVVSEKPIEQAKAKEFLGAHKYQSQYKVVLAFLAGEISQSQGESGLAKLLRMLNELPKDIVGLYQLILELRCLNEYLLLYPKLPEAIEQEFECMARLNKWIRQGLEEVRVYGYKSKLLTMLTVSLQDLPAVAKEAQDVLELLLRAAVDKDWQVRQAAIYALATLVKASPEHASAILPTLLSAAGDSWVGYAAIRALGALVKASPEHASAILPTLLITAGGEDYFSITIAAISALGELVKALQNQAQSILPKLLNAAGDENVNVRKAASGALVKLVKVVRDHEKILPLLLSAACDENVNVRQAAIYALEELVQASPGHASAILPTLLIAAGDENVNVRQAAIYALETLVKVALEHAPEVIPTLLIAAGDKEYSVRQAAIYALAKLVKAAPGYVSEILPPSIFPTLIRAAGNKYEEVPRIAVLVSEELVQASPEHALAILPIFLIAACDENVNVRQAAIYALEELVQASPDYPPAILPTLLNAAEDKEYSVCKAAIYALENLVKASPEHALAILPTLLNAAGDKDLLVSYVAIIALEKLVKASQNQALAILPKLLTAAGDENVNVRYAAIRALGELVKVAPEHASAILPKLLIAAGDKEYRVLQAAIRALGELVKVAPEHASAILSKLLIAAGDKEYNVRQAAIRALGWLVQVAPEHASAVILTLLIAAGHKEKNVRSAATGALVELVKVAPNQAPLILPPLLRAAGDENTISALGELVKVAPNQAPLILPPLLRAAGDENVRSTTISALVELVKVAPDHASEILPKLLIAAGDKEYNVRQAAIRALEELVKASQNQAQSILPLLLRAAGDKDYYWVRSAVIDALGELVKVARDHAAILPKLLNAAGDKESDVREAAIRALDNLPLATLMQFCFAKQDLKLSYIVQRGCHYPIVVQDSKKGYQQLVSYSTAGEPEVLGEYPTKEVEKFVEQVLKQVNDEQKE